MPVGKPDKNEERPTPRPVDSQLSFTANNMSSQLVLLLPIAAVVLSLSPGAFGFKCYVCNSNNDTACAKSPLEKRFLVDCNTIQYPLNEDRNPYVVCRHQVGSFSMSFTQSTNEPSEK